MKFRPCIDIHNRKVKQIVGSTLKEDSKDLIENFVSDKSADYFAGLYKQDGLSGGHVIMLGQGNEKAALKALRVYPHGLQIGGGINPNNARDYLNKGASHVIVTSYVFSNGEINLKNLGNLVNLVSADKLVLDLSCRMKDGKYYVVTDRWQNFTDFEVNEKNLDKLSKYCAEFLVHGVDVEGKCQGIEKELVLKLGSWAIRNLDKPITYAGGISSYEDIQMISDFGKKKVDFTVGSALDIFGGDLSYKTLASWFRLK